MAWWSSRGTSLPLTCAGVRCQLPRLGPPAGWQRSRSRAASVRGAVRGLWAFPRRLRPPVQHRARAVPHHRHRPPPPEVPGVSRANPGRPGVQVHRRTGLIVAAAWDEGCDAEEVGAESCPELPFDFIATKVHLEPKVPVTALCANVGHQ